MSLLDHLLNEPHSWQPNEGAIAFVREQSEDYLRGLHEALHGQVDLNWAEPQPTLAVPTISSNGKGH